MANNTNWLNISSMSGSSGQTILTLSAQRNLVRDYKTATIRAYNPVYNISAETYVTIESYTPYINVTPEIVGVPGSGGTYQLSVDANCSYVIAYPDIVSTYSTTAATGSTTITFSVPQTYEETTLIGNIVFTDESGQVSKTVRIEQYGAGAEIVYWPGIITFPSSGGEQYFSVSANCPYTITNVSGATWFTVSPSSGYTGRTDFTVTAGENTGDTNISGYISIDGPGSSGGVIEVIQQKAETRLVVGYYVTSTTEPTVIMNTGGLSAVSLAEYPDGTQITPATAYTFPATGMQYVYYTLTGDTVPQSMFDGWGNHKALSGTVKTVFIPNGITGVGQYAFYGLSGLTSVTLPDTLEVLSSNCFYSCAFSSITLPNSLSSIGNVCFSGCTSLSSITIPSGVTSIGYNCFTGSSVSSITFTSLVPPTLGNANAISSSSLSEIIVPCVVVNDYLTAWPQYSQYISCQDDGHTLYFITDTSNVASIGETRTITILNTNVNPNRIGLTLPSDFPQQGSYIVDGNVIYITYPRNPSYTTNRSWTIGVVAQTNDGVNLSGSYRITQLANLTYSIPYTADTSIVDGTGETRTITIDTSNLVASSITIGIEGVTGVTYSYSNGVIIITFPENNTGSYRTFDVHISAYDTNGNLAIANIAYGQGGGLGEYFTMEVVSVTSGLNHNIQWILQKTVSGGHSKTIYYRKNGGDWTQLTSGSLDAGDYNPGKISVALGTVIEFKGDNSSYNSTDGDYSYFASFGCTVNLRGNIMSLINSTGFSSATTISADYAFDSLFCGPGNGSPNHLRVRDASGLLLPAVTLSRSCYANMFSHNSTLMKAPKLPAMTLASSCYAWMFSFCDKLTNAPVLPVVSPGSAGACYDYMFYGCDNLNYVKCLSTSIDSTYCYQWLAFVSESGTFVKNPTLSSWDIGENGIPSGWTVQDAT